MVTEFKLTVVNFARPNQMQICAWIYRWTKKIVKNQDWAAGPSRAADHWPAFSKTLVVALSFSSSGTQGNSASIRMVLLYRYVSKLQR